MNEEQIFQVATDMPAAERAAYLATTCEGQPALRERVERLLASHDHDAFMQRPADCTVSAELEVEPARLKPEESEDRIGNYKLLQNIGEGGFGTVWMAEQLEPVRRRVALKIIKLGMDTREVIVRFEQERQALALMDHPNIAKVLDAGITPLGRPFFVMELVRGIRITDFCDQNNLPTAERLGLFIAVCNAIQHAHQKGIIHRDIKPSNILVTLHDGVPMPKVIDFGVAKAIQSQRLTDLSFFTRFDQMIGTPLYMSPEQAGMSGLDIDTRSDIYSLGVLLYELLTGKTPFDAKELMASGIEAMRKTIREKEPVRPSTLLTQELTAAGVRPRTSSEELAIPSQAEVSADSRRRWRLKEQINRLRGDLDWIVMKCLEKDRSRRYDTANGLAADLKRHLNNEPVIARPPSPAYKLQKAWRRNKRAFTAVAAVAVALLVGISLTTWQAFRANAEKITAQHHLYIANMNLAGQAWEQNNYQRLRQLLEETGSASDRGFEWYYWQRQAHLNLKTFLGHVGPVYSVAFSPDGQRLVTGGEDRSVRIWSIATGQTLVTLTGHTDVVKSVAFSPSGQQIVSGSDDQTVRFWDSTTGQKLTSLSPNQGAIYSAAFSRDGLRLVTGGQDGTAKVWDLATSRVIATLVGHGGSIRSATFSPDGARVLTGSLDKTARVWETTSGKQLFVMRHQRVVYSALFSPDGQRIVTGGLDRVARMWDAATGGELSLSLEGIATMTALAVSPDGRHIVSGSLDSTTQLWNATNGAAEQIFLGNAKGVFGVAISPDGRLVATAANEGNVKIWEASSGRETLKIEGTNYGVLAVTISPDGKRIAVGTGLLDDDGTVTDGGADAAQIWDANSKRILLTLPGHRLGISTIAFSPDGNKILTGSGDRTARLWDAASGSTLHTLRGHTGSVNSVAFYPDGARIVTASQDKTARVWDTATGKECFILNEHTDSVSSVVVSPDGKWILTGSFDATARLWDTGSGRLVRKIETTLQRVLFVAFSPDSRRIMAGGWNNESRVWDLGETTRDPIVLKGHSAIIASGAFSPDGQRIVTGSYDRTAKVWETATGRELLRLSGRTQPIYSVAFSPDGQRIVASLDQTVRIWEAATPGQVAAREAQEGHSETKALK